jgi:hypothetical protein
MATQIAKSDVDADIFHAFTKKITLVDIKNALSKVWQHSFNLWQFSRIRSGRDRDKIWCTSNS